MDNDSPPPAKYKIAVSQCVIQRKLEYGDPAWNEFNRSYKNYDIEMDHVLDAVYYGRAITTQHKNGWRTGENYLCGQHLGLDFDNEDQTSTLTNLIKDKFISKYAAFVHTTMSHRPEAPRARALFLLDTPIYQAKNYVLASTALLWMFGTADRKCKDSVRFFYGSPGCDFEYLGNVLPLEIVKRIIADYQEAGSGQRKKTVKPDYLPPTSQQEVAEALKIIDPWQVDYDEWVSILMAIHSQFGEDGYSLAENWADGKPGEVEIKWRSFNQGGNEAGAVTIATVFGIAKRFGWKRLAEVNYG